MGPLTRILIASLALTALVAYVAASLLPVFFIQVPFTNANTAFSFWLGFPWICAGGGALVLLAAAIPVARPHGRHVWAVPLLAAALLMLFAAFWWDVWSRTNWSGQSSLEHSALAMVVLLLSAVLLLICQAYLARGHRNPEAP
jgi:hypothetical protein